MSVFSWFKRNRQWTAEVGAVIETEAQADSLPIGARAMKRSAVLQKYTGNRWRDPFAHWSADPTAGYVPAQAVIGYKITFLGTRMEKHVHKAPEHVRESVPSNSYAPRTHDYAASPWQRPEDPSPYVYASISGTRSVPAEATEYRREREDREESTRRVSSFFSDDSPSYTPSDSRSESSSYTPSESYSSGSSSSDSSSYSSSDSSSSSDSGGSSGGGGTGSDW